MEGKRAVITGSSGFAARHLRDLLLDEGWEVLGISRRARSGSSGSREPGATVRGDISRDGPWKERLASFRPSHLFHLAARTEVSESIRDPSSTFWDNVEGTRQVLEAVRQHDLSTRVLYVSSCLVYRPPQADELPLGEDAPLEPDSPYGRSKLEGERLGLSFHERFGLPVYIARPFNHTGPGQRDRFVCSLLARQMAEVLLGRRPPVIEVWNLAARRDFTDVRDVVRAYLAIAERGRPATPYNVCTGRSHSVGEVIDELARTAGAEVTIRTCSPAVGPQDDSELCGDPSALQEATGWKARVPLARTLRDLVDYWREMLESSPERSD